jgi:creatinine amidohydrolase
LRQTTGMRVITTSWGMLGNWREIYDYGAAPVIDIHAGQSETSVMLALRPDLVDMTQARDFDSAQTALVQTSDKLGYHGAAANLAWLARDLNPAGAVGNAARATAEDGRRDIDAVADGFSSLIDDILRLTTPGTP